MAEPQERESARVRRALARACLDALGTDTGDRRQRAVRTGQAAVWLLGAAAAAEEITGASSATAQAVALLLHHVNTQGIDGLHKAVAAPVYPALDPGPPTSADLEKKGAEELPGP